MGVTKRNVQIYEEYKGGVSVEDLSKKYNLAPTTIKSIVSDWRITGSNDGIRHSMVHNDLLDVISELPVPYSSQTRIYSGLMRAGITSVEALKRKTFEDICEIRNIGKRMANALLDAGLLRDFNDPIPVRKDYYERWNHAIQETTAPSRYTPNTNREQEWLTMIRWKNEELKKSISDTRRYLVSKAKKNDSRFEALDLLEVFVSGMSAMFEDYDNNCPAEEFCTPTESLDGHDLNDIGLNLIDNINLIHACPVNTAEAVSRSDVPDYIIHNLVL